MYTANYAVTRHSTHDVLKLGSAENAETIN